MTSQLIAMLAAAGLVTAGVATTAETRSASAIPGAVAKVAVPSANASQKIDCKLDENKPLDECKDAGKGGMKDGGADVGSGGGAEAGAGGAAGGGGGGALLPVLLGAVGVGGIAAGLAGSSKG